MDPIVDVADLRAAAYMVQIPTGTAADDALARLLDKAQTRLLAKCPTLSQRLTTDDVDGDLRNLVAGVIEDMVLRVVRNPNGYRQVSIDDFTRMIDSAISTGAVYVSDDELELVCGPRTRSRGARSIRLGVPSWRLP